MKPSNFPDRNLRVLRAQRPQGFPEGALHQMWPPTEQISHNSSNQTAEKSLLAVMLVYS